VTAAPQITDLAARHMCILDRFISYWLFQVLHIEYSCSHKWQRIHRAVRGCE